jgi:hypothetical protein
MHMIADICTYQGESSHDRMDVAVNQPREQRLALQIDLLRHRRCSVQHLGEVSDCNDFIAADRPRFSVRMVRNAGEYLGIGEDALGLISALRVQVGGATQIGIAVKIENAIPSARTLALFEQACFTA